MKSLIQQREELLLRIAEIDEENEGIENKNNSIKLKELNNELIKVNTSKKEVSVQLNILQNRANYLVEQINKISTINTKKILHAINKQRWYYFKNKPKIIMDKNTGLLWANLDYFPYRKNNTDWYTVNQVSTIIQEFSFDEMEGFRVPSAYELWDMIADRSFPQQAGSNFKIRKIEWWAIEHNGGIKCKNLDFADPLTNLSTPNCAILPCSSILVDNTSYAVNVRKDNSIFTPEERLKCTLQLFVANGLEPIFNDDEITELFKKIYCERPKLIRQLELLDEQIKKLQENHLLSSKFDYRNLLNNYNVEEINLSIIQYYEAVQKWVDELLNQLSNYESQKFKLILNFQAIEYKVSKKYEYNSNLSKEENRILSIRQAYFRNNITFGLYNVKSQLMAVRNQADDLQKRIYEANNSPNSINELAIIEAENRASFSLIAENTAKILSSAIARMEFFEQHFEFIETLIGMWSRWTEDYCVFKTTYKSFLENACDSDGIEDIWKVWYSDWEKLRVSIEEKMLPIIEQVFKKELSPNVVEQLIIALGDYKRNIDKFYLEERRGIYQKFAFEAGGEFQDKFETESTLYKFTALFQEDLQQIIFECDKPQERIYILKWANSLLDMQIDEVIVLLEANNNDMAKEILLEFISLKQKNYELYIADAKSYSKQKLEREKQYNSLIFKMRKDLAVG
ncbi:MAG: hypothetical protein ATN36_00775 [Epulopiscium sp. Nele67-Bin005]|nr:MAG: hypothetical protein ATN36_00775 [Epulopiscium sp. Nele67-Bin005]